MSVEGSTKLALETEVRQLRERIAALERERQQEFLAGLLAHSPYGIAVLQGYDLRFDLANPAYQEIVGLEIPLIGRQFREVFPEAEAIGIVAQLLNVIETGEPWILRGFKAPTPGKPNARWAGQVVRLPAAADGEPCLLAFLGDVTEEVAASEARRETEARFRALVTSTSDVVFRVNADSTILLSLHGRGLVDDTDKPTANWLEKYVHFDDLPDVKAAIEEAIRTKGKFELEHRAMRANGAVGWALTRAIPILNAQGEVVEWFGCAGDITERKLAEERISQHSKINGAVNRIISMALSSGTEEELCRKCLAIIEEATESKFGFISEIDGAGELQNLAISEPGWEACRIANSTGEGKPIPGNRICGIFGRVILDGKGFFTNDPATHPDSIGTPEGHPPLKAFLGMPIQHDGKTIGMVAVANREGGYRQQDLECLEAMTGATVQVLTRVRIERALRESEKQFKVVTENLVSGVALIDRHGDYKIVNKSFLRMFDLNDPSEVPNLHSPDRSRLRICDESGTLLELKERPVLKAMLTRTAIRDQLVTAQWPDSTELKWLLVSAEPILDRRGKVQLVICTCYDITERQQAEARLTANLATLTRLHELSAMALGSSGIQPLLQQIVDAAVAIMGAQRGTLQLLEGDSLRIVAHNGHEQPFLDFFAAAEERAFVCVEAMKRSERVVIPDVEKSALFAGTPSLEVLRRVGVRAVQCTPMMTRTGKPLGLLSTQWSSPYAPDEHDLRRIDLLARQASDLIEQTIAEQALRKSEERERARAADMAAILETAPVAMLVSRDAECREIVGNETAYKLFRLPAGSNMAQSEAEGLAFKAFRDGREIPVREWPVRAAASTGQPVRGYEFEIVFPDGTRRTVVGDAVPLLRLDGTPRGAVGAFLDITERKQMERELERQNQAKDRFLAMLGHELRNPLAAMSNAMKLLAGASARERSSLEELMGRQIQVLRRLVDDLLDLSRIEQGRIVLQKEPVGLLDLLQASALVAQSPIAARKQELVLRLPSEPVSFLADRVRLEQVVANLLDNASKYTEQGGTIELSGAREGSDVVIRCKDNGRGISPEMQASIFEPFTRGEQDGTSSEAGLGIGLSLVERLVELHGGTISVQSGGLGAGSEFAVRLPWVKAPTAARAAVPRKAVPQLRRSLSIAIVEDNPDVARTRAMALEQVGHKVELFADGASALARIPRLKPDVMLIDVGLPDMDGYELAAKLRSKPELRGAMFIAISGFKRRTQTLKTIDAFDHYFVKPVEHGEIMAALDGYGRVETRKVDETGEAPTSGSLRVLLVEDHAELAKLTAKMLRVAGSGLEALDAAPEFGPQLVLCDLHLPDMSGTDVIRALRKNPATKNAYAVILTAMSQTEVQTYNRSANAKGVDEYLSKPLTNEGVRDLLPRVETPRRGMPK